MKGERNLRVRRRSRPAIARRRSSKIEGGMEAEMVGFLPKIAAPSSLPASSSLILKRLAIIEMAEGAVKWKGLGISIFNIK